MEQVKAVFVDFVLSLPFMVNTVKIIHLNFPIVRTADIFLLI